MVQDLLDIYPSIQIPIQHLADQINACLAHDIGHTKISIHDLVDAVEWILLVYDGVEEDPESPDVLLFATVWLPGKDFGRRIICEITISLTRRSSGAGKTYQ